MCYSCSGLFKWTRNFFFGELGGTFLTRKTFVCASKLERAFSVSETPSSWPGCLFLWNLASSVRKPAWYLVPPRVGKFPCEQRLGGMALSRRCSEQQWHLSVEQRWVQACSTWRLVTLQISCRVLSLLRGAFALRGGPSAPCTPRLACLFRGTC